MMGVMHCPSAFGLGNQYVVSALSSSMEEAPASSGRHLIMAQLANGGELALFRLLRPTFLLSCTCT